MVVMEHVARVEAMTEESCGKGCGNARCAGCENRLWKWLAARL